MPTVAESRAENLLALLLIQQLKTQRDKAVQLSVAGFTNTEIANLLKTTTAVVAQALYEARSKPKKKAKKQKAKTKKP
jgi:DNA-directed RNA polymerase specialized sigma24 family protein